MTTDNTSREAFEAFVARGGLNALELAKSLERDSSGDYIIRITYGAWLGWQACEAHHAAQTEVLNEAIKSGIQKIRSAREIITSIIGEQNDR